MLRGFRGIGGPAPGQPDDAGCQVDQLAPIPSRAARHRRCAARRTAPARSARVGHAQPEICARAHFWWAATRA